MHADLLPMVPGARPVFGHTAALRERRLGLFEDALAQGPVSQLKLMGRRIVVVSSPETAQELLVDRAAVTRKSPGLKLLLSHLAGEGLFMSEGELWRRQRRLLAPLFQPATLKRYEQVMVDTATEVARSWSDGVRLDLAHEMTKVTMEVVARTLFGTQAANRSAELGAAITELLGWANRGAASPLLVAQVTVQALAEKGRALLPEGARPWLAPLEREPFLIPGAYSPSLKRQLEVVRRNLDELITERRAHPVERDDLLSRLLGAKDDDGSAMSDEQVRDEAATLFVAGHETTANALAWSLHLLATNPEVRRALQREVDALGGVAPGFEALHRTPLAIRVFKEALRLYPPLAMLVRQALADFTLGDVEVPKGRIVFVPIWALHRNPKVWPEPERFDPSRFLPEAERARHRAAWLPFGLGPRVCIGNHFAMLEGPLVLVRLLQLCDFELEGGAVEPDDFATLRPRGGVWASTRRRAAAA